MKTSISEIINELTAGLDNIQTPAEYAFIRERLEAYIQKTGVSLDELKEQCWQDADNILEFIYL